MEDAGPLSSRRGRRILIALLILLLILLPLYLWPLRGGLGGLPGVSALPGSVLDPRSAGALARIPGDVWDALMGRTEEPPLSPPPTEPLRNLTMITQAEEISGSGLDQDTLVESLARGGAAQPGGSSDLSDTVPGGSDALSTPGDLLAANPNGGPDGGSGGGPWSGFGPGGSPGFGAGGGSGGGGPRFSSPGSTLDPDHPGALEPTPEPGTLVLIGSNLALLGAAAWKRRRRVTRFGGKATTFWRHLPLRDV